MPFGFFRKSINITFGTFRADQITGDDGVNVVYGLFGDDEINTLGGNDRIFAGRGDDTINAGDGDDRVDAGRGDDRIEGGAGNDRIDGGRGEDTAVYTGSLFDYEIDKGRRGTTVTGEDGTDRLQRVEVLEFDDATVFLDGRNDDAIGRDDTATTEENTNLTIAAATLTANDLDLDGDALSVVSVSATSAAGAAVSLIDGEVIYTPGSVFDALREGETATDTFTYQVTDGLGGTSTATVIVTITGTNDAPELTLPVTASVEENTSGIVATANAVDVDSADVTFSLTGDDAAFFSVDAQTGAITLDGALDFEVPLDLNGDNTYDLAVTATDTEAAEASQSIAVTVTDLQEGGRMVFSEIMFNPASSEDDWEWVEISNTGSVNVDLSGYVLDDGNNVRLSTSNIASGTVVAGGPAVLYNADDVTEAEFRAAWSLSDDVTLIAVSDWSGLALNNGGDTVSLWLDFDSYAADDASAPASAVTSVTYDDSGDWPSDDGAASIYLTDLSANPNDGANWALSTVGDETPAGTARSAVAEGGNSGADIGSPGEEAPAAEPFVLTQSFETEATGAQYFNVAADGALVPTNTVVDIENIEGLATVDSTAASADLLGYNAEWFDTRDAEGLADGDFVGVTNFTREVGTFTDGARGYRISDPDGLYRLSFDAVDLSAVGAVTVSLDYFLQETGWETSDVLNVYVVTDQGTQTLLDTSGLDIDDLDIEGVWNSLSVDLGADVGNAQLVVEFDSNASSEAVYIDNISIQDTQASDTALLSVAADAETVTEGDDGTTDVTFTVTRSGDTSGETSVDFTVGGDVDADDFGGALPSSTVTFADGETEQTITVALTSDTLSEADEDLTLTLGNASGNAVIENATATTIVENDDFAELTMSELQGFSTFSDRVDQTVQTSGIVTDIEPDGFYM
ncbi:MAG: cadherin-like domain-containing protein [Pseudomonadota bacterium]